MEPNTSRLLIVDDDENQRASLAANLEAEGYQVVEASTGLAAIKLFQQNPFDLVITDARMPGMDGLETFRAIRRLCPKAIVVMMTGFANEVLVTDALSEGAYAVLYKPFAMQHFMALVARAIARRIILVVASGPASPHTANLMQALRGVGLRVESATDRDSALQYVGQGEVDLCILDLSSGTADGSQLYEEIHGLDPTITAIVVNGHQAPQLMHKLLRQGSYSCMRQPLDIRELISAIARARRDFGRG